MNYKKIYDNLVSSRKYRGEIKRKNDGFNKHHILPKCQFLEKIIQGQNQLLDQMELNMFQ